MTAFVEAFPINRYPDEVESDAQAETKSPDHYFRPYVVGATIIQHESMVIEPEREFDSTVWADETPQHPKSEFLTLAEKGGLVNLMTLGRSEDGDQLAAAAAREKLIITSLPFVSAIVRRYAAKYSSSDRDDLYQTGAEALVKGIDKYASLEPAERINIHTYVYRRIVTAIKTRGFVDNLATEMPATDLAKLAYKYLRIVYDQNDGNYMHPPAVARQLNITDEEAYALHRLIATPFRVNEMSASGSDPAAIWAEANQEPTEKEVETANRQQVLVERTLSLLSPRDAQLLKLRFGMGGGPELAPEDIDRELGLTSGSARGMINGAKLRMKDVAWGLASESIDLRTWSTGHPLSKNPLLYLAQVGVYIPPDASMEQLGALAADHVMAQPIPIRDKSIIINVYKINGSQSMDTPQLCEKFDVHNSTISRVEKRYFKRISHSPNDGSDAA